MLARTSRRSREVAIRAAVGASRVRIATQLLTGSVVLAYAAVRVLLRYSASQLPRLQTVPFDTPVLLFAIAMLVVWAWSWRRCCNWPGVASKRGCGSAHALLAARDRHTAPCA